MRQREELWRRSSAVWVCQPARWDSVTEEERGREGFRLCSKQGMQRGADTAAEERTKSGDKSL